MTLNAKTEVFMDFLATLSCETHFHSELRRIHYRQSKTIFSIERRFQRSKSRPSIGSRKPVHEYIKERYPIEVVILPLLASLLWKRLQIGMYVLPITTSSIVTSLLVNID